MDLQTIQDNIELLESSETTPNNVAELACLYICQDHLKNANLRRLSAFNEQIREVLPAYSSYCECKRNAQLGNGSDEAVFRSLQLLCQEIEDLYKSLYSTTSNRKESRILKDSIQNLSNLIK